VVVTQGEGVRAPTAAVAATVAGDLQKNSRLLLARIQKVVVHHQAAVVLPVAEAGAIAPATIDETVTR
jgi:trimethylamine:corrinoid methyltransferase-like protein